DARQIDNDVDIKILQFFCWSNSGELQQLRSVESSRANDDFARRKHLTLHGLAYVSFACLGIGLVEMFAFQNLDADRALVFEENPGRERVKLNREIVREFLFRLQQKVTWAIALAVCDCEWREREPLARIDIAAYVVWIEPGNDAQKRFTLPSLQSLLDGLDQNANNGPILQRKPRIRLAGIEPSFKSVI